ncbi:uncharacterized protein BP5553_08572 [Venustampulla echinocandica]|uniref:Uncharacterized protein n=1 Tax=Venustampulla echinocandica TaxID=2656787 RepID=A0A370TEM3_9HELO|nr:uncharacterized protein BP5553_08572 [Venustampulla echinocandica]RDL33133.1 hypothetical protein BP5553_08572 [Venustampulla echinocandica]
MFSEPDAGTEAIDALNDAYQQLALPSSRPTSMKPEPKSIFTSRKDFSSQSNQERTFPLDNHSVSSTTSTSTSPFKITAIPDNTAGKGKAVDLQTNIQYRNSQVGTISNITEGVSRLQQAAGTGSEGEVKIGTERGHSWNIHRGQHTASSGKGFPPTQEPERLPSRPPLCITPTIPQASKHPRSDEDGTRAIPSLERPSKRSHSKLRYRRAVDPELLQQAIITPSVGQPPSPLFFSHSSRQRPLLPQGFSSSEAVTRMINKGRDEAGGITTLKLARGSVISNAASPTRSTSTYSSLASPDMSNFSRSSDTREKSPGMHILNTVGVIELLEQDERPTFIIDVANPANFDPGGPLIIVFANASLRACEEILDTVTSKEVLSNPGIVSDFPEFKAWALSFVKNNKSLDISLPSFSYEGLTWTCSTLRKRLRIIRGSEGTVAVGAWSSSSNGAPSSSSALSNRSRRYPLSTVEASPLDHYSEPLDYFGDAVNRNDSTSSTTPQQPASSPLHVADLESPKQAVAGTHQGTLTNDLMIPRYPDNPSFDWTRLSMSAALPKHIQFALSVDWAATPLGPIEGWGFDLRAMCNLVMGSPHPAAMYWGDEYIAIYNEAYIMIAGQKHPHLMGQSYKAAWAEIWDEVGDVISSAKESGQSIMKDNDCLFLRRNGYLEESFFSWSIVPLVGEDGSVVGLYNPAFEMTRRKIAERRMLTLREIGDMTAAACEVRSFWGQVIKGLEYNEYDVPFAFLYSVSDDSDSDMSSIHSGSLAQAPQCVLEGTIGVPEGHKATMSPLDLKAGETGFVPYLRESMKTNKPILLTTEHGTLSSDLIDGLECRGFGDPCRAAVVCPIQPTTEETILGFLVLGINPRRPYDDDYSLFVQLLSRQLATSMASVVLFEDEIQRGQRAARLAALDRQELSKQLDLRTREKMESETKFTRMAEFSPVGMFIANSEGQITYSNCTWWEISRHPRSGPNSADSWMDSVKDEDRENLQKVWKTLIEGTTAITHEFRFKAPWHDRNGNVGETWVLLNAYPEKDDEGQLKSVFGSITNISSQKSVEDFQKRRMEEAIELKRQQENFIDMTSHEMRNPLSAILQCSDEITTSLAEFNDKGGRSRSAERLQEMLDNSLDAAQTITLCAQHQKRIVDDILTLSKLDSALLVVTPIKVHPVEVVQRALKMFEGELETNGITMEFRIEQSYVDLDIDQVKLDPSRLIQVLINLTTNAMKFTQAQERRTIIVSIGASKERPKSSESGVTYFPSRSKSKDINTDDVEWGTGDNIFLTFAVQDTGRGLDENEKRLLFQRFRQASPRTHVQYGGSGLGLFISRELTELQGGEIGVSSERHVGSTFAFYIRARKVPGGVVESPEDAEMASLRGYFSHSAITLENIRNHCGKAISQSDATGQPSTVPSKAPMAPPLSPLDRSGVKILIVEDNLVNQRVLQKQLKNAGFGTQVANHGGEALAILKNSRSWSGRENDGVDLSLILMDLEMPVMDGLTTTRKIRDFETDGTIVKHVPLIAVTANARLEQIETAINAGMDDVVSKPFRIQELIPKIEELVSKSNAGTPSQST